ncbi:MAG: threonylcarbamoyl-AMP synthase [Burkholderiales bacterium]|nr:threonylcarbamoyl-AMP synthase [Burkholderiales bacterium]
MLLDGRDPAAIDAAAQRLAAGSLVALPTETVYGLGARADDDAAVARIFAAKGRPADHPLIVHVPDAEAALAYAAELPAVARRLMEAFWPGPLTVIVPRRPGIGQAAAGGQDSIGLRCPAHPVARALLQRTAELGVTGVAAPSANRFGRISPTQAAHVMGEFAELAADELCVLDGGACEVGIESTILDCRGTQPVLLRPGVLTREQIEAVAGPLAQRGDPALRASGTLAAHYAPRARVRLMATEALKAALAMIGPELAAAPGAGAALAVYCRGPLRSYWPQAAGPAAARIVHRLMPPTARLAAHSLFADLRELDTTGAPLIWVEAPPDEPAWDGVRDRLQRAAAAG